MLARTFALLFNSLCAAWLLSTAVPGPHRVLFADSFGMSEIAPRIWTDAPARKTEILGLIDNAQTRVAEFFGDSATPVLVICTRRPCAKTFGIRANGLSFADNLVIIAPRGVTLGTLTHELTHSRLHRSMGLRNIFAQPFPTWFDEGLATLIADHPRWQGRITTAHRNRVRKVQRFWQWDDAFRDLGVGRAYRAAAAEVREIEDRVGRAGLADLIRRVDAGQDFDTLEQAIRSR